MKRIKNIIIFLLIPICIILLLVYNGHLASKKYNAQEDLNKNTYIAKIKTHTKKMTIKASEEEFVQITVKNEGTITWIPSNENDINLAYHIIGASDEVVLYDGERTKLPNAVRPGEEISVDAKVKAPDKQGTYKIEFDMVHEGVTWFKEKGSQTFTIVLEVE